MALLEYWAKAIETPTTVTYRFGPTPQDMGSSVVIHKQTATAMGVIIGQGAMVAYLAAKDFQRDGAWPEQGVLAS